MVLKDRKTKILMSNSIKCSIISGRKRSLSNKTKKKSNPNRSNNHKKMNKLNKRYKSSLNK